MSDNDAVELFFDALEGPDVGYFDRQSGEVDMQAADIVKALLKAGWVPPAPPKPNERVAEVDTVTFHKYVYVPGQDMHDMRDSIHVNPDILGWELGRVQVGDRTHVGYTPDVQRFVCAVAWVGDVAVYRFETREIPAGSMYSVGPFPLVMTLT